MSLPSPRSGPIAGLFALAGLGVASPALAQWYERPGIPPYAYNRPPPPYGYGGAEELRDRPLPPRVIVDRLEDRGFDDVGFPRFNGSVYAVEATGPSGVRERVIVDAYLGRIVQRVALGGAGRLGANELDEEEPGPRRRLGGLPPAYSAPPEEMAPRPGMQPQREAARPGERGPLESRPLAAPADPRLAPGDRGEARNAPEPRREAARPQPSAPQGSASPLYGVNPDRGGGEAKPKPSGTARLTKPTDPPAATPPRTPAPPAAAKPEPKPKAAEATADSGRKPVRVIEGVTPMNSGAQGSPAPQNQLQAKPEPAPAAP